MTAETVPDPDALAPQGVLAGPGSITVIAGLTFAISDERGDMGQGPFGLIADDTRHLSGLRVLVDSEPLRHLGSGLVSPSVAHFRGYATGKKQIGAFKMFVGSDDLSTELLLGQLG